MPSQCRVVLLQPLPPILRISALRICEAVGKHDQILPALGLLVALDVAPGEEGLDHLGALLVRFDQCLARGRIDHEGFVVAGLDAIIDLLVHVFA